MKSLRIIFMGTPDFSVGPLKAIHESGHEVICVYSQPPRPKGRGKKIQASPVHQYAEEQNIEVRTPVNFKNTADVQCFTELNADVAVVAAYGLILPKVILDAPRYGCINIHASILPRWRGAAPIHRAIWAGDTQTGVTLMQMDEGLDTGDMIAIEKVTITNETTLPLLHDSLSTLGATMIVSCLNELTDEKTLEKVPQAEEGMTYAKILNKDDGRIDWNQSAIEIDRQVRALNPWPSTWCMIGDKRLKILEVEITEEKTKQNVGVILEGESVTCGQGSVLRLVKIQPENKKPMDIKTALNGGHINVGDVLL